MASMTAREIAELANMLFANEANLLMFNALVDIDSGDLDEELLQGDDATEPPFPQALAAMGMLGPSLCFGTFGIGDTMPSDEALQHLRDALTMLPSSVEADPLALVPALAQEMRTLAALTVSVDESGARFIKLHLNPAVDPDQAIAHLLDCFREIDNPDGEGEPEGEPDDDPDDSDPPADDDGGNGTPGGNGAN